MINIFLSLFTQTHIIIIIPQMYQQAIVFPRIAIKTNPGTLIVRETEKVLGEKITTRTEEVPCPVTGVPHLRTVEVVEKLIETEVVNTYY